MVSHFDGGNDAHRAPVTVLPSPSAKGRHPAATVEPSNPGCCDIGPGGITGPAFRLRARSTADEGTLARFDVIAHDYAMVGLYRAPPAGLNRMTRREDSADAASPQPRFFPLGAGIGSVVTGSMTFAPWWQPTLCPPSGC